MNDHHRADEEASKVEVLERIGRNLLLFQQAERWVKHLAVRRRISGMSGEWVSAAEKLRQQVAGETLGTVVRRAVDPSEPTAREQERIEAAVLGTGEVHLEVGFRFTGPDGEPDAGWQQQLKAMVQDRNELVHQFLGRFDLKTTEGCREASLHLDEQHARHAPVVEDLRRRCATMVDAGEKLAALLKREDVRAEFLHGHLRLNLDQVLRRVADRSSRADGWTCLSLAGAELADDEPGLLKQLEDAFRHRGLREVVASMDGWELRDEPTEGGIRVLYRCSH